VSPEVIEFSNHSAASDIWSVGCTVIELLTGFPPYFDLPPMTAMFRIVDEKYPSIPNDISQVYSFTFAKLN
jgi:serine/threonine protein kinase